MAVSNLLAFACAYFAVLILPGPGVTSLVARVLARGPQGSSVFIAGFLCGSVIWLGIAATGLAALAATLGVVFVAIRYVGAAYLLYLAWKLWNAPTEPIVAENARQEDGYRLFLVGLAINLGNPKVIVFFLALLPSLVRLDALAVVDFVKLALLDFAVGSAVLGAYVAIAMQARRAFKSAKMVRLVNQGSGLVIAGSAVAIIAKK